MKILITAFTVLLLLASCTSEDSLMVSEDNQKQLNDNMVQFDAISEVDNEEIRVKLIDFYELATVNNCDPGNFGIVTPTEAIEYVNSIGFATVRAFHNWTVDYGTTIRDIVLDNPDMNDFEVVDQVTLNAYSSTGSPCGLDMALSFNKRAYRLANTYGVYVQGSGFRQVSENDLFLFGGAFNTFVQTQELQQNCDSSN